MKNEVTLIRLLSRLNVDSQMINKYLSGAIDWRIFFENVFINKVSGLVLYNLQKIELLNFIPKYINKLLVSSFQADTVKLRAYFDYIAKISEKLNNENVSYAFIKGFDLIDKIYFKENRFIRSFNDLDILVAPKDLSKIEKLFLEEGFVFGNYNSFKNEIVPADRYDVISMKMTSHQLYPLVKKVNYDIEGVFVGPIFIDINFTIFDGGKNIPNISTEQLLETTCIRKAFNGVEYKSLDIYYTFVQLVCHLYREANTELFREQKIEISLQKFCDIYEYLMWASNKWEITRLKEIIYDANLVEPFWFVLYLTDILYETTFLTMILNNQPNYTYKYEEYIICFKERFQLS